MQLPQLSTQAWTLTVDFQLAHNEKKTRNQDRFVF